MKRKRNQLNLIRLEELMQYPEFNRLMAMKTGVWVSEEKTAEIEAHNQLRQEFQEEGYLSLLLPDEKGHAVFYPPLYQFDLIRIAHDTWDVSYIDPIPPAHIPFSTLIPRGTAYALAKRCSEKMNSLIEMVSTYPQEWNVRFDFKVAMISRNHVTGAMREDLDPILSGILNSPGGPSTADLKVMAKKFPIQVAMYCLYRSTDLQNSFYGDFHDNLLPELMENS